MYISTQNTIKRRQFYMQDKTKLMETVAEKFSKLATDDKAYVMGIMQGILLTKEKADNHYKKTG